MAEISYSTVLKKPGSFPPEPLPSVILVVGTDDRLKREAVQKISDAALDPSFADFDQETVDLSLGAAAEDMSDPVGRIIGGASSAPFASPKRVVTVFSVQKLTKERQDSLALQLSKLSEFSLVILIADASEMEAGRPKGRQVENSLRKAAAKSGIVLMCDSPEGADLRARALQLIADAGKSAGPGVIEAVIASSSGPSQQGADLNSLLHETAKLISYVGDRPQIVKADASAVLISGVEENVFRLLDCVGARDIPKAFDELEAVLLAEGKPDATAARLIVLLQRQFRLMALAKFLSDSKQLGKSSLSDDIKSLLPGELASFAATQGYRLSTFARQASNYKWSEIQSAIDRILASDLSMKGIMIGNDAKGRRVTVSDDPSAALKLLIFDLCYRESRGTESEENVRRLN